MPELEPRPLIVAGSGDPGGANALGPVLETLRADGRTRVQALAYRHAREVWQRRGLAFEELAENSEGALQEAAQLVLTSTSLNGLDLEKQFVAAARMRGIPSLVVLDYWSKYRERFSSDDGALDRLPDMIAVMDEQARAEMIVEGFDADQIVVTGQPAFDELPQWRADFTDEQHRAVRAQFGVDADGLLVVFASQPFASYRGSDSTQSGYMGFEERAVAASLLRALEAAGATTAQPITLVIRPHPRENLANFDHLRSARVRLQVTTDGDARAVVLAADLVVGMNSVLLVEACHLGCPVLSLQPNLRGADPLPSNRLGVSRAVYVESEIAPAVRALLFDSAERRALLRKAADFQPPGDAARRVADLAEALLRHSVLPTRL